MYLAGGIARKIAARMTGDRFITPFVEKGRMQPVLRRIPVHVILNPDVGLLGAARVAAELEP
jgi:glucokinase